MLFPDMVREENIVPFTSPLVSFIYQTDEEDGGLIYLTPVVNDKPLNNRVCDLQYDTKVCQYIDNGYRRQHCAVDEHNSNRYFYENLSRSDTKYARMMVPKAIRCINEFVQGGYTMISDEEDFNNVVV